MSGPILRGSPRRTLRRIGGKLALRGCRGACCGCTTIRRYNRCAIPGQLLPCVNQPGHVWLCEPAQCPGTIQYINACYTPTATTLPLAQLPPGDELVALFSCASGCDDPGCTRCQLFCKATPCPGTPYSGPPVFVPIERVPGGGCGGLSFTPPGSASPVCFSVECGTRYTLEQVLAAGGPGYNNEYVSKNFLCCECVQNCAVATIPSRFFCATGTRAFNPPVKCCCTNDYSMRISLKDLSIVTVYDENTGQPSQVTTWDIPMQTWTYDTQNQNNYTTFNGTQTIVYPQGGQGQTNQFTFQAPMFGHCGFFNYPGSSFGSGVGVLCPGGNPAYWHSSDVGFDDDVLEATEQWSCVAWTFRYRRRIKSYFTNGGVRGGLASIQTVDIQVAVQINYRGNCSGGCGQTVPPPTLPPLPIGPINPRPRPLPPGDPDPGGLFRWPIIIGTPALPGGAYAQVAQPGGCSGCGADTQTGGATLDDPA